MEEESAAVAMVSYFTNCVAQLRDRAVYVQFSTHAQLKTDQTHSNASASAQAALQAAQALAGVSEGKEVVRIIFLNEKGIVSLNLTKEVFCLLSFYTPCPKLFCWSVIKNC